MFVEFYFEHQTDKHGLVSVPSNLMLAYTDAKKEKRESVFKWIFFVLLAGAFCANAKFGWYPLLKGPEWEILSLIGVVVCAYFLGSTILWDGPRAALLFVVMNTETFSDYLDKIETKMQKSISYTGSPIKIFSRSEVKEIEKELMTIAILRDLMVQNEHFLNGLDGSEEIESNQIESDQEIDLYDMINYIADNCENVRGFVVRETKNVSRR